MGFLAGAATSHAPVPAVGDLAHHARVEASAQAWIDHGSQRPTTARVIQLGRLAVYLLGAVLVVSVTDGLGPLPHPASWWGEPIVFQKLVVWTLVWQLLGLGRGLAPHGVGALPSVAALSYWLTPGTMRLPPAPDRIPFTRGTRRTVADVVLYGAVLAIAAGLLGFTGTAGGTLPRAGTSLLLVALVALGLRDRTPLLAARPETYVLMLVTFLLPLTDTVLALKLVLVALWWVAAVVRTNRHFPFAVATTLADAPWVRTTELRRRLWQRDSGDTIPSDLARLIGRTALTAGYLLPLVLLLARGGAPTVVAVGFAVALQAASASTLPRHGQLESSTFGIIAILLLFGHHASVGFDSVTVVGPMLVLGALLVALVVGAAFAPVRTAVLSPLRHAAGCGPVSVWLFAADSVARFDVAMAKDVRTAEALHYRDLGLHALQPNGRALDGLLHRAVADLARYRVRPAEFVAGAAVGWGITSGFDHDRCLLAAIQERCAFAPGGLRVVTLDAHAMLRTEARYRVLDAATGLLEEGLVDLDDMIDRVPWRSSRPASPAIPVEVDYSVDGRTGYSVAGDFGFLTDRVTVQDRPRPRPVPTVVRPRPSAIEVVGVAEVAVVATDRVTDRPRPVPVPRSEVVADSFVVVAAAPRATDSGRHAAPDDPIVAAAVARPRPRRARHASSERG